MKKEQSVEVFKSIKEAAHFTGVSRPTFSRDILPKIPHRRVGRRILVTRTALTRWLAGHDDVC